MVKSLVSLLFDSQIKEYVFLAATFLYTESPNHPTKVAAKNIFL